MIGIIEGDLSERTFAINEMKEIMNIKGMKDLIDQID